MLWLYELTEDFGEDGGIETEVVGIFDDFEKAMYEACHYFDGKCEITTESGLGCGLSYQIMGIVDGCKLWITLSSFTVNELYY